MFIIETYKLPGVLGEKRGWCARLKGSVIQEVGISEEEVLVKMLIEHGNLFGIEVESNADRFTI